MPKAKMKSKRGVSRPGKEDPFRHHFRSFQQELRSLKAPKYGSRLFRGAVAGDVVVSADAVANGVSAASGLDPESVVTTPGAFFNTLGTWRELNLSETFRGLSAKCYPLSVSLGMVIHNAAKIHSLLRDAADRELEEGSDLSLEPVLELWHALATDVGGEAFKEFLPDFCSRALRATRLESIRVIQQSCSSLAEVLKIVQRSQGCDDLELAEVLSGSSLQEAWPQPGKMPEAILVRIAGVLAQVVRRSSQKEALIEKLISKAEGGESPHRPFVAHSLISCCVTPSFKEDLWKGVVQKMFSQLEDEDVLRFWTVCCEKAGSFHSSSYDNLTSSVLRRCRKQWAKKPLFYLDLMKVILEHQENPKPGDSEELLRWISKELPLMSSSSVPFATVHSCVSSLLDSAASGAAAKDRTVASGLVDAFLVGRGGYSLEKVCAPFWEEEGRRGLWRETLKSRLSVLALKLDPSEENLLGFARVANGLVGSDSCESAVLDVPEGSPERKESFPNKLLSLAIDAVSSWESKKQDLKELVCCLSHLRPLSTSLFEKLSSKLQKRISQDLKENGSLCEDTSAIMQALFRAMRKMFCPISEKVDKELFVKLKDSALEPAMSDVLSIVCAADPSGAKILLEGLNYQSHLVDCTLSSSRQVRMDNLKSLCALAGEESEAEAYDAVLQAEREEPSVGGYRERLRLFRAAKTAVAERNHLAQRAMIQSLVCNFFENFSLLWKPVVEMAAGLEDTFDRDMVWNVLSLVLQREGDSSDGEGSGAENIMDNVKTNVLRVIGQLNRSLSEAEVSLLVKQFKADTGSRNRMNTHRKACRNLLQEYFSLFSHHCPKDTKERESVVDSAHWFLKDSVPDAQKAAAGFLIRHTKGVQQYHEELTNLCDKQKWKKQVRTVLDDLKTLESNPRLRKILKNLIIGLLRRTAREKASDQISSRKTILQSTALVGKDFLFEVISDIVADLNPTRKKKGCEEKEEEAEWQEKINYQMVVDLCIFSKPMMSPEDQAKMNDYFASVVLQMGKQPGLFEKTKDKKKFLDTVLRISKSSKDLAARTLLDKGVVEKCLLPVFLHSKKLPTKLFSVLDCWVGKGMSDCLFHSVGGTSLFTELVKVVGGDDPGASCKAINVACKLIRRSFEDKGAVANTRENLDAVRVNWEGLHSGLMSWLTETKLELQSVQDRLFAVSFFLEKGWLNSSEQKESLAKALSAKCRTMEDHHAEDWLKVVTELIRRSEGDIPDCLFGCVMSLTRGEHREKLCGVLSKGLGHGETNLDSCMQDLIEAKEAHGRKTNLFVFYGTFSLLYKYAGTSWVQGMNLILNFLKKLLRDGREEYEHVAQKCLLAQIKRGFKSKDDSVFCSCATLLRFYLETAEDKERGPFRDLVQLMDVDDDTDFFENAKHLQFHRRGRIMRKVASRLESGDLVLTATTLAQVMLPMARRYVLAPAYKDQTDLVDAGMTLIGAACCKLKVDDYIRLLEGLMKRDKGAAAETKQFQKQKVDVMARIIQGFSYDVEGLQDKARKRLEKLMRNLLQQMRQDKAVANLHVYISVAKLSVFLSQESCVNTIVLDLCSRLRIKFYKEREIIKKTIFQVLEIFGPRYLHYLASTLDSVLQRGYQVHVRIHALAYVLNGMRASLTPDIVSTLLEKALENVSTELFSDFTREKKVEAILKKTPEAKKESGYHVLRLLSSAVSKGDLLALLAPFLLPRAHGEQSQETLDKCRKAALAVSRGMEDNRFMERRDKLLAVYGMLHGKLGEAWSTTNRFYSSLQQEFALSVLSSVCRDLGTSADDLRPFVPSLMSAVRHDDVEVSCSALALISTMIRSAPTSSLFDRPEDLAQLLEQACSNMKRFHRSQSSRVFSLTCQLLEAVLQRKASSVTGRQAQIIKSYCLSALDTHPTRCMKILATLLRRSDKGEEDKESFSELLKQVCRLYVERPSKPLAEGAAAILVAESARTGIVLDFMLENFNYPDQQGRSKVISLIQKILESRSKQGREIPASHAQKIFLLSAHRLANEEMPELRSQLQELLRTVLQAHPSLSDTVVKWSASEEQLKRLVASKLASVCGEAGLMGACLAATRNIFPVLEDGGSHDLLSTMLKSHVIESCSVLLEGTGNKGQRLDLSFLGSRAECLAHLMLSPMASLRRKLLPVLATCLTKRTSDKQFASFREEAATSKILFNLFELLKTCPAEELRPAFFAFYQQVLETPERHSAFFHRLRGAFNYERREEPRQFSRRLVVLDVLGDIAADRPGWQGRRVHTFLSQFEESEEVGERVKEVLGKVDCEGEDEEEGEKAAEGKKEVASPSPAAKAGKAGKRRIMSNTRSGAKRQKL